MAKYVIEDTTLTGIADAIREKTETTEDILVTDMAPKILGITSGGMTASIFVTGLSESDTVTASYGDKTKVAVWNSTESRHEITGIADRGLWTVTATSGEDTVTNDVLIDTAAEFEVEMTFDVNYLMLYDFGDECEEVTGGWTSSGYSSGTSGYTVYAGTKNVDNLYVASKGSSKFTVLGTATAISLSDYVSVGALLEVVSNAGLFSSANKKIYSDADNYPSLLGGDADFQKGVYVANLTANSSYFALKTQNTIGRKGTLWAAFVLKSDNWQTLCSKAELSAPADLATLIADTTSITAILAKEVAVRYMVAKCTGDFMAYFVASSDCLSALDASPYKSIVLANRHWAKFLNLVGVTA